MMHYQPLVDKRMAEADTETRRFYKRLALKKQIVLVLAVLMTLLAIMLPATIPGVITWWWLAAMGLWAYRLILGCLASYPGEY